MKTLQTNIKRIALATAVAMASLSAAPAAMAQSHHGSHDYNRNGRYDRQDHRVDKARERAYRDYRHDQRRAYNQQRKDYRRWARGQYIPRDYLGSRYYTSTTTAPTASLRPRAATSGCARTATTAPTTWCSWRPG